MVSLVSKCTPEIDTYVCSSTIDSLTVISQLNASFIMISISFIIDQMVKIELQFSKLQLIKSIRELFIF